MGLFLRTLLLVLVVGYGYLLLFTDPLYKMANIDRQDLQPHSLLMRLDQPTKKYPFIRLLQSDKSFITTCSGFVVSKNMAVTAAHCLSFRHNLLSMKKEPNTLYFASHDFSESGVAHVVAFSAVNDIAFIRGDFSNFDSLRLDLYGNNLPNFPAQPMPIRSCGYPFGGILRCVYAMYVGPVWNNLSMQGSSIFSGMSGGPIMTTYDLKDTNNVADDVVIGVNMSISITAVSFFGAPVFSMLQVIGLNR